MTKVVFMGSDEFSVPALLALQLGYEVASVVTQPDRPAGRGRLLAANPVKRMAEASGIPIMQPESLRTPQALASLAAWEPDVIVVAAYGQILRRPVLELPPHGCINVHASLLPRWRGASPIAAAILAGDVESGVTIIKMDAGMDTGPILDQRETIMEVDETSATLTPRLAEMGAQLLVETLELYLDGMVVPRPQPSFGITLAPMLRKEDGLIDWTQPAEEIDRRVRAFNPWPGAYSSWRGQMLKIWEVLPMPDWGGSAAPGTVLAEDVSPLVATGAGALWLTRVQLAGKKTLSSDVFLRGQPDLIGSVLGGK